MLGLGIRKVKLGRRSLAASLHEIYFVICFTDQNPLHLSTLGGGFGAASQPVSDFLIWKNTHAHENGIKINFDACPGGVCRKKPGPKKKPKPDDDDLYSDDSDLESCDEDD